jgi:predicted amidophosphoribosyltransferase
MFFWCLGCGSYTSQESGAGFYLCLACQQKLERLRCNVVLPLDSSEPLSPRVWILYRYQAALRQLILRAKIRNSYQALNCLILLAEQNEEMIFLLEWADVIMAAPSSLWSRLRGRVDIAGFWAYRLAQQADKKHELCTAKLAYRTQKRALLMPSQKNSSLLTGGSLFQKPVCQTPGLKTADNANNKRRILLIDDIYTTGFTMRSVAKKYAGQEIRCLALAGSPG